MQDTDTFWEGFLLVNEPACKSHVSGSAEGAQELPTFLKDNWHPLVFMDSGKSGFYSLKRDAKNW